MTHRRSAPAIRAYPSSNLLPAVENSQVSGDSQMSGSGQTSGNGQMSGSGQSGNGEISAVGETVVGQRTGPSPALIAMGAAVLALFAGVFGVLNPVRLVLIDSLLDHPLAILGVVVAALAAAVLATHWSETTKWALLVLAAVLAIGLAPFAVPYLVPAEPYQISSSQHGSLEAFTERVAVDGRYVWMVGVRERDGLTARQWPVGCVGQDRAGRGGVRLTWPESDTVLITAVEGPSARVRTGADGRPLQISDSTNLLRSAPTVGPLPLTICV